MNKYQLLSAFIERSLGTPLQETCAEPLSGWQAVEALWPLNGRFRPNIERIRSLPYDPAFEPEADEAIEALVVDGAVSWDSLSAGAWRVLLERQQQAIVVAMANEIANNPLMPIPPGLSDAQRTVVVAVFLLHGMALPWPAEDRSDFELPQGSARASLRPH